MWLLSVIMWLGTLIDGAVDPAPEQWGKTTVEEQSEIGLGGWPGVTADIKPPNATLLLYGGAAFERVMHEFRCAAYSIECPSMSREKVANILLAHAGRGGGRGVIEAAAEIARSAARSWLAPLLETACDRLAFVLGNLYDLALEQTHSHDSKYWMKSEKMDGYVGFHAALRQAYNHFIEHLSKQCKQLVQHHIDSVTSPYSQVCYESSFQGSFGSSATSFYKFNQASAGSFCLELTDGARAARDQIMRDQENVPLERNGLQTTPGRGAETRGALRESQLTVPETPSPDQPCDAVYAGAKKEFGNGIDIGAKLPGNSRNTGSSSGSAYSEICSSAAEHFARIREVLIE